MIDSIYFEEWHDWYTQTKKRDAYLLIFLDILLLGIMLYGMQTVPNMFGCVSFLIFIALTLSYSVQILINGISFSAQHVQEITIKRKTLLRKNTGNQFFVSAEINNEDVLVECMKTHFDILKENDFAIYFTINNGKSFLIPKRRSIHVNS